MRGQRSLVVAEPCADGNLVTALGTAAAENGCARLGLHPGKEPVRLRAVAAVRLEGTLRHLTRLLLNFFAVCNSPSVYLKRACEPNRTVMAGFIRTAIATIDSHPKTASKNAVGSNQIEPSQGMVQRNFLSLNRLKSTSFSVLTSNPLTKDEFGLIQIVFWFTLSFLFAGGVVKPDTKVSSKQRRPLLAPCGDKGLPFALAVLIIVFGSALIISKQENLD